MTPVLRHFSLLLVCAALSACSSAEDYISSINPFNKNEPRLAGERQAVLVANPMLQVAPAGDMRPVSLPLANMSGDWLNPGGPASNAPGNASLNAGGASKAWSAPGKGGDARAISPPLVVGNRVYIYDRRAISAYNLSSGASAWTTDISPQGVTTYSSGGGIASDGQTIYAASGQRVLAALNASSGEGVWKKTLSEPARGAPTVSNGRIYLVTASGAVYAFAASTGDEIWRYAGAAESGGLLSSSSPAVSGDLVIVPLASGDVVALDAASGTQRWSGSLIRATRTAGISSIADVAGRPVVSNGVVYAGSVSGRLAAVRKADGTPIWEKNIATAQAPVVAGDAVFVLTLNGEVYALDSASGALRWSAKLPSGEGRTVWSGPLLANQMLWVVSNRGALVSLDARNGQIAAQQALGAGSTVSPIAAGGHLIIATSNAGLIAVQ